MPKAAITAVGGWVPPTVLSNEILEQFVETSDQWITERTGIKERRILVDADMTTSDMAVLAIKDLLKRRQISPEDIQLLICATVTPDHVFPATANIICDKLDAKNAWGFDLEAACSSFLYGLVTGAKFIEAGTYDKVLVVGVDRMSAIIDYEDRTTCVIFGDGAGAVLLEPTEDETFGIQAARLYSDGSGRHFLFQKAGGAFIPPTIESVLNREHFVYQEGKVVFNFAIKRMVEAIKNVLQDSGITAEDVDWLVPHQANLRIIRGVARMLGFPEEKITINIQKYGNTTSATIPLCLWEWQDKFRKGDNIILTTFGGGFTWGAVHLRWAI